MLNPVGCGSFFNHFWGVITILLRDESNTILLFEDPYKNQLQEDESSKIVHDLKVNKLKTNDSINEILNRQFREL